ncbi:MAG: DMT family transporter [Acidimicrobiia bacterium]|nr:DMT family transporter [Acidimicrobiia bacterium]
MPYQVAALLAAASWAVGAVIAANPAREMGGPRFTRLRMIYVSIMLLVAATMTGGWESIAAGDLGLIAISAIVGLLIGDVALFTAMAQIGPRRTGVLFTANAPMAAIGGVLLFGERFTPLSLLGAALTVGGIVLAVLFGTARGDTHVFERIEGSMVSGVIWATVGALGQAVGALAAKPVLDAGADTVAVAAARAVIATVALWIVARPTDRLVKPANRAPLNARYHGILVISGVFGMVIGMTLVLYALGHGDAGVTTILSATTPVMLLPLIWVVSHRRPTFGAWVGAATTVVGTALLV